MKKLFLLLLAASCVTSQNNTDYRKNLVKGQLPYVLADYELKGDVVGMQLSYLNSGDIETQLDKFDTERLQFKDGYLSAYEREGLSGDRYTIKKTVVEYGAVGPDKITTTRNGLPFGEVKITYDSKGRLSKETGATFTTVYEYDSDSNLIKSTDSETKTGKIRNIWTFDFEDGIVVKKSLSISDRTSNNMERSSYKIFKNGGIIKDVTIKDGQEEVYLENELDTHGNVLISKNKYNNIDKFEYVYDQHDNWVLQIQTASYGDIFVKHRIIDYADGTRTGEEYLDVSKIASIKNLTHDPEQYRKYQDKVNELKQ